MKTEAVVGVPPAEEGQRLPQTRVQGAGIGSPAQPWEDPCLRLRHL